ncbi:hypothetical protein AURDEDRAFT_171948 [Auricularia subglabra TFB-10046 SS5]|nr:hypothetical protein AURDEDRAFT_171948 [Auricularia subglabra TFB-10046 SS5]
MCFAYLPGILDCLAVSHVSRFWRATAITFPALWSDIRLSEFSHGGSAYIIDIFLARSGNCPVDIGSFDYYGVGRAIGRSLRAHIHHIRSIAWSCPMDKSCFDYPAPMLENISSRIPSESFLLTRSLGGVPGKLRVLNLRAPILPSRCPAMSTVSELSITASHENALTHLSHLFHLCPRLTVLSLDELRPDHSSRLPHGPIPRTLKKLTLAGACDIIDMLPRFQAPGTQKVDITMPTRWLYTPLTDLAYASSISLEDPHDSTSMFIIASPTAGRTTRIEFPHASNWPITSYERICSFLSSQALPRAQSLTMPLAALSLFLSFETQLGPLTHVRILVRDENGCFPWQDLECLPLLPASVSSVVFEVAYNAGTEPHALDVSTFLVHFASACPPDSRGGGDAVHYVVRGFPSAIVSSADKDGRERARLNLSFEEPCSDPAPS